MNHRTEALAPCHWCGQAMLHVPRYLHLVDRIICRRCYGESHYTGRGVTFHALRSNTADQSESDA